MKKLLSPVLCILASIVLIYTAPLQAFEKNLIASKMIDAKPIKRISPEYPLKSIKKDQEGWVIVNFMIDKKGNVVAPFIETSSGERGFNKAAIKAVKKWKYTPATYNGEAIEEYKRSVKLVFRLSTKAYISRNFHDLYESLIVALEVNDLAKAKKLLKKIYNKRLWNYTESSFYWLADAMYAEVIKDEKRELISVNKALATKNEEVQDTNISYLLARQFVLNFTSMYLSEALKSFKALKRREGNDDLITQLQPYANKAKKLLNGTEPLKRNIMLNDRGLLVHRLSRNSFSLSVNDNALSKLEIRCENKRLIYDFENDKVLDVPKKLGKCDIIMFGKRKLLVEITEY